MNGKLEQLVPAPTRGMPTIGGTGSFADEPRVDERFSLYIESGCRLRVIRTSAVISVRFHWEGAVAVWDFDTAQSTYRLTKLPEES